MAGMAFFTACSSDDEVAVSTPAPAEEEAQEIVLQVANDGDNMVGKRGGRPLYSSEAAQNVDYVVIYAINSTNNKVVKKIVVNDWMTRSEVYNNTTEGDGRKATLRLSGENKLGNGTYYFVAYGYHNAADAEKNTYTYSDAPWTTDGNQNYSDIVASLTGPNPDGEEVFAGENVSYDEAAAGKDAAVKVETIEVSNGTVNNTYQKGFTTTIRLARQVAGAFGYFRAIPASVNGTAAATLRLVTSAKNTAVKFTDFNTHTGENAASGTYEDTEVAYVVNGQASATADAKFVGSATEDAYVLYSIDLEDWFPNLDDNAEATETAANVPDGLLGLGDTWANPYNPEQAGDSPKFVEGSVFAGRFVIPFNRVDSKPTMQLQLLSAAGDILKTWNVKLAASDPQVTADNGTCANDDATSYTIVRNHMYNLGYKAEADNDTEIPDTEEPMDLSGDQDLILDVHANWELLHQMELE